MYAIRSYYGSISNLFFVLNNATGFNIVDGYRPELFCGRIGGHPEPIELSAIKRVTFFVMVAGKISLSDAWLFAHHPFGECNRITSYNVCYTKLLRTMSYPYERTTYLAASSVYEKAVDISSRMIKKGVVTVDGRNNFV